MDFDSNIEMLRLAYWNVLAISAPVLVVALVVGLVIGVLQAATSVNEQTLSFVPKLALALLTMALAAGFMLTRMTEHFTLIFDTIRTMR